MLDSPSALDDLGASQLADAALTLLDWPLPRDLARLAPTHWTAPVGRTIAIDYATDGGPTVECKVQEAYGLSTHPAIADGRIALTVALLSPAFRPVAVTRDLPSFWKGGYHDMRKDMKGRYPKHDWPEDPAAAAPTSRARPRGA
jgi:ATP-dependent helicase HrpB